MSAVTRIIRIKAQPHVPGGRFCRAGRCFGTAFTTLREDELTAEQLAALRAEPMLWVEAAEELKPTAPQAKAEAKAKEEAKPTAPQEDEAAAPASDAKPAAAPAADAKPEAEAAAKPAKPAAKEGGK